MTTFLDTNVLISISNSAEKYHHWSVRQLKSCLANGPVIISDIVYCEFCAGMPSQAAVDLTISALGLQRMRSTDAVLFRAGAVFKKYRDDRRAKSTKIDLTRNNILIDFMIGALAEAYGASLVTANRNDFRNYFPGLHVIDP